MSLIINIFLSTLMGSSICGSGNQFGANCFKNYQAILSKDSVTLKPFNPQQHDTKDRFPVFNLCMRINGGHSDVPENEDDEFSESIGDLPRDDANSTQQEINSLVVEMNSVLARLTTPTKVISFIYCEVNNGSRQALRNVAVKMNFPVHNSRRDD
jgi:hypothetical protein